MDKMEVTDYVVQFGCDMNVSMRIWCALHVDVHDVIRLIRFDVYLSRGGASGCFFFTYIYIWSFPREDDYGFFVTMKGIMCYLYNYY